MENCLFIRQFWNLIVEVNQKVLQIIIIWHEEPEILIRFFKSYGCNNFQILYISVKRLK